MNCVCGAREDHFICPPDDAPHTMTAAQLFLAASNEDINPALAREARAEMRHRMTLARRVVLSAYRR